MATIGTITENNVNKGRLVLCNGVTTGNESPVFTLYSCIYSSFTVSGTFGAASGQFMGSNDGVNYVNIGSAITVAGGGTLTPATAPFLFYKFVVTGGAGTLNFAIFATGGD